MSFVLLFKEKSTYTQVYSEDLMILLPYLYLFMMQPKD